MKINKQLALYLLLGSAVLNQKKLHADVITDFGPIQITTNGSNTFGSGIVKFFGTIEIGHSSADVIKMQGQNINPSLSDDTLITLGMDPEGIVQSTNGTKLSIIGDQANSYISVDNILDNTYNVTLNAGNTGNIILASSGLTLPTGSNNYILTINQSGAINSSLSPSIYIGSLEAAQTSGQSILLGSTSTGNNGFAFTNNSGDISLSAGVTNSNLNLSANGYINIATGNITNPDTGLTSALGIDENGNLVVISSGAQTFTDLTAAASTTNNETIALGNTTNGNYLTFVNNTGNVSLTAGIAGSDLLLTADNNIVISSSLVQPTSSSQYIGIDTNGNLTTLANPPFPDDIIVNSVTTTNLTASRNITLGDPIGFGNFLVMDGSGGNINLSALNGDLIFNAFRDIVLISPDIPLNGLNNDIDASVLSIDNSNRAISSFSNQRRYILGHNSTDFNFITVDNYQPNIGIEISSLGRLRLYGNQINTTGQVANFSTLAIGPEGDAVSSDLANSAFMTGTSDTAYMLVDTDSANQTYGVTLGGNIYLSDLNLRPSGPGSTNVLTIDSNGKIGIQVSTATKKTNIKKASSEISWNELEAHQYNYIGSQNPEFGYIAEELAQTKDWNKFVIYDHENHPMSVNYNGIFVAAMHIAKNKIEKGEAKIVLLEAGMHIAKNKIEKAEAKIALLEKEIANKNIALESMAEKFVELDAQYKILAEQIAQLKLYQQANQQK